jgi:hypothetical protein
MQFVQFGQPFLTIANARRPSWQRRPIEWPVELKADHAHLFGRLRFDSAPG